MSSRHRSERVIGVISDTHGLLRPQALAALRGVELIVHAGDIGSLDVITALQRLAPVVAIRGNNDSGAWARPFAESASVQVGDIKAYVLHDLKALDFAPKAKGFGVVIAGHSHRPSITERDGVLFVNPGSAGPRRFTLPVAVARLFVRDAAVRGELVILDV